MKATELRQKSKQELSDMLVELSREQFNLRMQKGTGQLTKTAQVRQVRRDIARIHTVINELQRA
jgi:large subunit ribosomal protein L29